MTTLADFAAYRIWCAWQLDLPTGSGPDGKVTKIPHGGNGFPLSWSDRATWVDRASATRIAAGLAAPYGQAGIGVFLGPDKGGVGDTWLIGIDFDSCLLGALLTGWAEEAMILLDSYGEISPSGTGTKVFCLAKGTDIEAIQTALGIGADKWAAIWKSKAANTEAGNGEAATEAGNGDDKAAGVEVYLQKRWFAVTGEEFGPSSDLAWLTPQKAGALRALCDAQFGPKKGTGSGGGSGGTSGWSGPKLDDGHEAALARWDGVVFSPLPGDPPEFGVLAAARRAQPVLDQILAGKGGNLGGDKSRSALAFYIARDLRAYGLAWAQIVAVIEACSDDEAVLNGWYQQKCRTGHELYNIWRKLRPPVYAAPAATVLGPIEGAGQLMVAGTETTAAADAPAAEDNTDGGRLPIYSDEMLAQALIDDYETELRYTTAWGRWLIWDKYHWREDKKLVAEYTARMLCVAKARTAPGKIVTGLLSARTIGAVEKLARSDPRINVGVEQWDADPMKLNTPGGILDLETGRLGPADPRALCMKATAITPDYISAAPLWAKFLQRVTGGDRELEHFLARMAGYCLTGVTKEQALFFLHGDGGNGKGTFMGVLTSILGLGGYTQAAEIETFTMRRGDHHKTEIARLHGARLVTTTETEEGKAWAESRIKELTGGDPITANFMRQDKFTFVPQFKLVISGNHKPRIRAVNEAMRRRMNLIPFTAKIPSEEKDKDLAEKLKAEYPQILAWMVRGCQEWQRIGLAAPEIVRAATADYLEAEDSKQSWFEECCALIRGREVRESDLYGSWRIWAERAGEHPGAQKSFAEWLDQQSGISPEKNEQRQRVWRGVTIKTPGSGYDIAQTGVSNVTVFPGVTDLNPKKPEKPE